MKIKTTFWKEKNNKTLKEKFNKIITINIIIHTGATLYFLYNATPILALLWLTFTTIHIIISVSYNKAQKEIEQENTQNNKGKIKDYDNGNNN